MHTFYTNSRGIANAPEMPALLGGAVKRLPYLRTVADNGAVVGWGAKQNAYCAERFAQRHNLPFYRLEDGFISYLGHPALGDRRCGLIVDKSGIYYDAMQPCDLEQLLNHPDWLTPNLISRSAALIETITRHCISKYNHEAIQPWQGVNSQTASNSDNIAKVLVVDQTFGDCSVSCGLANADTFQAMLNAALQENPEAEVWVKIHPDVLLGKKKGYFTPTSCGERLQGFSDARIRVLADKVNAQSLLSQFDKVYVVTSQLGFEALLHRKAVVCFGAPFYGGWGLTDDRINIDRRQSTHTIESLFAAACLLYTRYIDPETAEPCELEQVVDLIVAQRRYQHCEVNTLYLVGFSLWKRAFMVCFVHGLAQRTVFVRSLKKAQRCAQNGDGILLWGANHYDYQPNSGVKLYRCEDAFVRGVGLGAELKRPSSLVLDGSGIYFDSQRPSDLETLISDTTLTPQQLAQAVSLRQRLLDQRISKYNLVAATQPIFERAQAQQHKILIAGQVDSDASIRYGSPQLRSNLELLQQVRRANPDAYIVYKPHPDVVIAGRAGHISEVEALQWVDRVVVNIGIFEAIAQCDALHITTSLAGFEAVMQGKTVYTWGLPFYAGWGFTVDHITCARRSQPRSIETVLYCAYIGYSRYVNWQTRRFTTLDRLLNTLQQPVAAEESNSSVQRWLARKWRKLGYLMEAFSYMRR